MNIQVHKTFLKELASIPVKDRIKIENFLFEEAEKLNHPFQIPNLRKLKGYSNYYRIRFGNYRAGVRIENSTVFFERIIHRKDIYKYYP